MKILSWNVRGAARTSFISSIRYLIDVYKVDICLVLEPRTSGTKAKRIVNRMGFNKFYLEDARGFAGGIWVCWNNENGQVEVIVCTFQVVIMVVGFRGKTFVVSTIYGSPQPSLRRDLWRLIDDATSIVEGVNLP